MKQQALWRKTYSHEKLINIISLRLKIFELPWLVFSLFCVAKKALISKPIILNNLTKCFYRFF